jgi:hypothetical protein
LENAPEFLRLLVQALALFATWLDRVFKIPWPLVLAVFFVPVVAALDVGVWCLRGMTFPIPCGYIRVHGKGRCQRMTLGEWHKCWYHRKRRLRRTDKHLVDPNMRRWETGLHEDDPAETLGVIGRGLVRMRSRQDTLLYHQGFARLPRDVRKIMPEVLSDYKQRAIERWASVRSLRWRGLFPLSNPGGQQIATSDVLPGVINATRLTLVMVVLGLVLVGVSIAVPATISVAFEYFATFLFLFALAFTRSGIWRAKPEWVGVSIKEALKWIVSLTALAAAVGGIGLLADDVKDVWKTVVETAVNGFVLIVVVCICYILMPKKKRRRSRRKWRF